MGANGAMDVLLQILPCADAFIIGIGCVTPLFP
jgi:hypothetical protein